MLSYTYGVSANDVLTDQQGLPVEGAWIAVTDPDGQRVTGLTGLDGATLDDGWVATDAQGRYGFLAEAGPVLTLAWQDRSWPVVAVEQAVEAITTIGQVSGRYRTAIEAAGAASSAARLATSTGDANELADEAESEVDTLAAQTITLDELYATIYVPAWVSAPGNIYPNVSGAGVGINQTVFIAPFALVLHEVRCAWEYWGITASNSTYWDFKVYRLHWDGDTDQKTTLATSSTQVSGDSAGGGVTPRTARIIEVGDDTVFSADDLCLVGFIPHGNPADMYFSVNITVSYSPA